MTALSRKFQHYKDFNPVVEFTFPCCRCGDEFTATKPVQWCPGCSGVCGEASGA